MHNCKKYAEPRGDSEGDVFSVAKAVSALFACILPALLRVCGDRNVATSL